MATRTAIGLLISGGGVFVANYIVGLLGAGHIGVYLLYGIIAVAVGIVILIRDANRNSRERSQLRPANGST